MQHRHLILRQLSETLQRYSQVKTLSPPHMGWIRAIREALGMSATQLADRLKVSRPRVHKLEQDELTGSVTIKTMRQTAEALDCVFVYAMVPRTSLRDTIEAQARVVAKDLMNQTSHSMFLEDQLTSPSEQQKMLQETVDTLVREMPRDLWSKK